MLSVTHSKDTGIVFNGRQVATKDESDTEMFRELSDRVSKGIQGNNKNSVNAIYTYYSNILFSINKLNHALCFTFSSIKYYKSQKCYLIREEKSGISNVKFEDFKY